MLFIRPNINWQKNENYFKFGKKEQIEVLMKKNSYFSSNSLNFVELCLIFGFQFRMKKTLFTKKNLNGDFLDIEQMNPGIHQSKLNY